MLSLAKLRAACRLAPDESGMAATEFALIAPVMIALYFGVTELADGLLANTKTASMAATAGDLAAQNDKLCNSEMNDIFAAVNAIMFPYPATTATSRIVISSLVDNGSGGVNVAWSDASTGVARTVGSTVSIPTGLVVSGSGDSVILAEVTYNYSSPAGELIYGTLAMTDTFYTHPRRTKTVTRTTSTCS
jgi:Flp pilus assembly protein TadG